MSREKLLGAFGEATAARYLRRHRFRILAMNHHSRFGELDIVAREGKTIVFVEVKLRRVGGYAPAADYVTTDKIRKLRLTAESWLVSNELEDADCRFDIIEVYLDAEGRRLDRIHHIREAF